MATPQITLTAKLQDISGSSAGSAANPAILRIALAGYGLTLPCVIGTSNIAQVGPKDYKDTGAGATATLWGNDVISPARTFYAITILDGFGNILQTGRYRFTGTAVTIDLSRALQLLEGANTLIGAVPNGTYPGNSFTVPIPAYGGTVPGALYYNGALQAQEDFTLSGSQLTLKFDAAPSDNLFVNYAAVNPDGLPMQPYIAIANGAFPGTVYTLPTAPPNGQLMAIFLNGSFQPPPSWTLDGQVLTMGFATSPTDEIQALYMVTQAALAGGLCAGTIPGTVFTTPTTPTSLSNGQLAGLYTAQNSFMRPGIDYTIAGDTITTKFMIAAGDTVYAYYI